MEENEINLVMTCDNDMNSSLLKLNNIYKLKIKIYYLCKTHTYTHNSNSNLLMNLD